MKQHYFIAPLTIDSPRWLQSFPNAKRLVELPSELVPGDCCWIFCNDIEKFERQIKSLSKNIVVIAMTAIENFSEARQLLASGASGYVHYLAVSQVLVSVDDAVSSGSIWLGADLMRQLVISSARILDVAETKPNQLVENTLAKLTEREKAVAECAAQGKTNKEIARVLHITERTVKAHLSSVFEKCEVRDRLQLVLIMSGKSAT